MGIKRLLWETIEQFPPLYRLINSLRGLRLHRAQTNRVAFTMATRGYGGWPIPHQNFGGVAYCFGIGRNTVFERALSKQPGSEVHLFDPSPASLRLADRERLADWSSVHSYGISEIDDVIPFTDFDDRPITSILTNPDAPTIALETRTLPSITADLGHTKINMLKLTIEGREYSVIKALLASDLRPDYLFVEFHHGLYGLTKTQTRDATANLAKNGYELFWVSDYGRLYAFVRGNI